MSVVNKVTPIRHYPVIIIGAGQAGMSISYCLAKQGIEHILIEKESTIAHAWKTQRWDEFCLVTPNWQCQLPGFHYAGDDPDGFMVKDEIIDYLDAYYESFKPNVKFNRKVVELSKTDGVFEVVTSLDAYTSDQVVLACGTYHRPNVLPFANSMPKRINHIHSSQYKNAGALADGEVLVVGTGQSGCQIAEDLHLSGRKVHLAVGTAPRVNRRYRGKDVVQWLEDMGYYTTTIDKHPDGKNAPHSTNHYVTGRDGGRDLNLRIFAEEGMKLYGKLKSADGDLVCFESDLKHNLDYADEVAKRIRDSIEEYIDKNGIDAPVDQNIHSEYLPEEALELDLEKTGITSVVWATGFKTQFDWVKLPVFDGSGQPDQKRGVTPVEGLYFLGLNWMNTWGSGRFFHVGRDAEYLVSKITTAKQSGSNSELAAM